jgi:xylose isomerase
MTTVRFAAPLQSILIEEGYAPMGFLRIPGEAAEAIAGHEFERRLEMGKRRGFGSVKVTVTLGASRWQTSLFPNKDGSWFLPVKKQVRVAEGLLEGEEVEVELELH